MSQEHMTALRCVHCGQRHPVDAVAYTCPHCGIEGILDVEYDYNEVAGTLTREALAARPLNQWRYEELLPLDARAERPALHVGMTPVYESPALARDVGLERLVLKDEGRNPTGSFKDRSSALAVMKAREAGRDTVACASAGNAAASLAGFAAVMGVRSVIFVPQRTPEPKLAQLLVTGARVLRVEGSYDDAYWLCQAACERYGWYNRNCAINPYLVEGKKTAGLELAEQLGARMTDWVAVSVGDGCTLAGIWKGLKEMKRLGLIERLPRMMGVQAAGAAPVAAAMETGALKPMEARTLADSIAVGWPRNWRKAVDAVRESGGCFVSVEDAEMLAAQGQLARRTGVFAEPAAAAALAGLVRAVREKRVDPAESATVVVTGHGLKDVRTAMQALEAPLDVAPRVEAMEALLARIG
ncbi:threonine synthase [Myxococcus sp. RHSTA-1-4]|uniref:threonine synthase n=1 Tax=Myxococcus sp. RHSTA-1-4 TaxID=2874601 RepID=UPI001CBE26A1|nr:threonine synthase [Myxococcus sp. RHSTA-1-4]MBZ4422346.1 threonine synthase [Myxococcus sp. RHSTA-1-4]